MQETQFGSLMWKNLTSPGTTKPMHHNYRAWELLQLVKAVCHSARATQEKPLQREAHTQL